MRIQMTKLEIDVPDAQVEAVIDCIVCHARTGAGHPGVSAERYQLMNWSI